MEEINSILKQSKIVNVLVSMAVVQEDKYLLVEEAKESVKGLWNFPAGKVKLNEDLIIAAKRETLEETGYECEITDLLSIHYFYWDDMPGLTIRFNFWGRPVGDQGMDLADDVSCAKWFNISEIEKLKADNMLRSKTTIHQFEEIKKNNKYPLDVIIKP